MATRALVAMVLLSVPWSAPMPVVSRGVWHAVIRSRWNMRHRDAVRYGQLNVGCPPSRHIGVMVGHGLTDWRFKAHLGT